MKYKHKLLFSLVVLQAVGAITLTLSFYLWALPFELLLSFTPLIALILIVGLSVSTIVLLLLKHLRNKWQLRTTVLAGLAFSFYGLYFSLTAQLPAQVAKTDKPTITFATFNKLYSNRNLSKASNYFNKQNIDVLAVQEAEAGEVDQLRQQLGFEHTYASKKARAVKDTVVGIVSRYPFESVKAIELTSGRSLIRAVILMPNNSKVAVYAVHLPGPFSLDLYKDRNIDTVTLSKVLQKETLPAVIGGDFNTTIFSPSLRQFTAAINTTMQPVTLDRWPQCSWYGFTSPMCLRIDHVYIPKAAQLVNVDVSPNLGSDHRAVIVEFTL